ncbi:MAG: inositol monophosphatase [Omnitrophica bacterium]|nr:inositol monophosphatase [Candidatus Omnitrophota bacterium]
MAKGKMIRAEIEKRKKIAIIAAREVGKILTSRFGKTLKVQSKGDRDLVTDIDKKADRAFIKSIKRHFPDDGILSEESPVFCSKSGFRWIIDPIDGTHNFIHKIEIFGSSYALEFKGRVVLGIIYMPRTDEFYLAQKGKGAYCNGRKISVSGRKLKAATLVYDSSIRLNKDEMLKGLGALADRAFNVRMFGSSVRGLTYLAEGKVEAEIEFNDKAWDFAAGLLLVEEAGGRATDFQGQPWSVNTKRYVASNKTIHEDILKVLKRGR